MNFYSMCTGYPKHWLWGNLDRFAPDEKSLLMLRNYVRDRSLKVTRMWLGPFYPTVDIHHCDVVKDILKEPKQYSTYRILDPWLGDGLLISRGAKWRRNRRLLTPAFHYEILKPYVSVYNSCVKTLLKKWTLSASNNEPVKLFDTVSLLSLDIILQCAFSYTSDCQNVKMRHPYIRDVYELIELVSERFFNPLYHIDWVYALVPAGRRMKKVCRAVHKHSERVIQERRKALGLLEKGFGGRESAATILESAAKQRKYLDFLDILLTAVDEDGMGLTDLEIRNEADTFMFEGHDTTTSGISWTLYCLAKYPEHQDKVREEVRRVLKGRETLEYDDLKELKYTLWCIKEAMRLYPPVFIFFREASEDLELDGYIIPKGMQLSINIFNIHRQPDTWPNPDEFDPLRFHPSNADGRHPFAYMPFSAGHRNCIGQIFAMNEEKIVVAAIVHRFSLSVVEDHAVELVPKVILRTTNDIKLTLKPLKM